MVCTAACTNTDSNLHTTTIHVGLLVMVVMAGLHEMKLMNSKLLVIIACGRMTSMHSLITIEYANGFLEAVRLKLSNANCICM